MKGFICALVVLQVSLIQGQIALEVKNSCTAKIFVNSFDRTGTSATVKPSFKNSTTNTLRVNPGETSSAFMLPSEYNGFLFAYPESVTPSAYVDGVTQIHFTFVQNPNTNILYYVQPSHLKNGGMNYPVLLTPWQTSPGCSNIFVDMAKNAGKYTTTTGQKCTTYISCETPLLVVGDIEFQQCAPAPKPGSQLTSTASITTSFFIEFCGASPVCGALKTK